MTSSIILQRYKIVVRSWATPDGTFLAKAFTDLLTEEFDNIQTKVSDAEKFVESTLPATREYSGVVGPIEGSARYDAEFFATRELRKSIKQRVEEEALRKDTLKITEKPLGVVELLGYDPDC